MKSSRPWVILFLVALLASLITASYNARSATPSSISTPSAKSGAKGGPALELAQTVSAVTGIAISPLLGVSAMGAWQYFRAPADKRSTLSWYAQPWFWLSGLALVGLVAAKDVLGAATPPGLKKPIDVAEALENKISGLVAAGALIPMIGSFLHASGVPQTGLPIHIGGMAFVDGSMLLQIAATPFALAAYAVVWMAAHSIQVLILLSPLGIIDVILKSMRTALLSALAGIAYIDPWIGAALSVALILVAYLIAGWSFRLSITGWVYCWDFLSFRWARFTPSEKENWAFASQAIDEVPIRTYGRLVKNSAGQVEFHYRPLLFLAEKVKTLASGQLVIGRALFHPTLEALQGEDTHRLFNFPPRFQTHEKELSKAYSIPVQEVGLLGATKAIAHWLSQLFGFSRSPA